MLHTLKNRIKQNKWLYTFLTNHKRNEEILERTRQALHRTTPQAFLKLVDVDIASHCNLNCYSCDHFSQLAEASFYDLAQYRKDMERLSALTQAMVEKIHIIGGEPLLNPKCTEYCAITRRYFPHTKICIITNGILLLKQPTEFWEACRDHRIELTPTKYPIRIDWEAIEQKCKEYGITLYFFNQSPEKYSYKTALNPKGNCNPTESFMACHRANNCTYLKNGKIFPCAVAPSSVYFNKHFNENLRLSDRDSIDIHEPSCTYADILEFLAKPIPFCRYCDIKNMTYQPWLRSKKDIYEYYPKP